MADSPKTTALPYDLLTQTEYRDAVAARAGIAYSGLDPVWQTVLNRIIDSAHEEAFKRAHGKPHGKRLATIAVNGDNKGQDVDRNYYYSFPSDFRRLIVISESDGTTRTRAKTTDYEDYLNGADGVKASETPWQDYSSAIWAFYSMSDDAPPVQQWVRIGGTGSGVTATVLYVPMLALLGSGSDSYTVLPAQESEVIFKWIMKEWKLAKEDYKGHAAYKQSFEEAVATAEIMGRETHEDPIAPAPAASFQRELG